MHLLIVLLRTHRERKEQYIKALEIEVARLRDAFVSESATVQHHLRHSELLLRNQQQENMLLREMLNSRGVAFEVELQQRKNAMGMGQTQNVRGMSPSYAVPRTNAFFNAPPSTLSQSVMSDMQHPGYTNGTSSHSPGSQNNPSPQTHHSYSPPEHQEIGGYRDKSVPDMPGIFEDDPQLGIDFILAYVPFPLLLANTDLSRLEETCRDHGEYLVRRSLNSPDDPEKALFSGHALMASVPPPTHIERTPAQEGGLKPTYPHQAPQASMQALNTLLNLSNAIKMEGYVEGGQVTPIMALQSLRGHGNYRSLTRDDVVGMIDTIRNKVRCYGFGAVMESFELRDALAATFATKPESYASFGNNTTTEIDDMYS